MFAETFHISSTRLDALCIVMVFAGFCIGYGWRVFGELNRQDDARQAQTDSLAWWWNWLDESSEF